MVHYEYIMIYLKYFLKGHRLNFYGPFDPNINPHLCHDMTYPPTKFDVDFYYLSTFCILTTPTCWPQSHYLLKLTF